MQYITNTVGFIFAMAGGLAVYFAFVSLPFIPAMVVYSLTDGSVLAFALTVVATCYGLTKIGIYKG